jgi:hypothetical protein
MSNRDPYSDSLEADMNVATASRWGRAGTSLLAGRVDFTATDYSTGFSSLPVNICKDLRMPHS